MSTEIAIVKQENVQLILQDAPKAWSENQISHERCINFGKNLLETINQQGMNDELDQQAAKYIGMSRATVKKMLEKRSPLTKLFDEVRAQFTSLENDIDPTKKDTVPYQLQQLRNAHAAKKREEEERKRQEVILRQQEEQARSKYRADVEDFYRRHYNSLLCNAMNQLTQLFTSTTLDNYEQRIAEIKTFCCDYPETPEPAVMRPVSISIEELAAIKVDVADKIMKEFDERIKEEIPALRTRYIDMMPSKKVELERASQASEEEAKRIRMQIAAREAEEAARREQARREREEQERKAADMKRNTAEMNSLFDAAAASQSTSRTSVKKKLVPLNVEAFPEIITLWWTKVGQSLTVEELAKMFKKQITYCEKLANDGELINSENICYEDEVKAK